jgi:hypothetical protein
MDTRSNFRRRTSAPESPKRSDGGEAEVEVVVRGDLEVVVVDSDEPGWAVGFGVGTLVAGEVAPVELGIITTSAVACICPASMTAVSSTAV